MLRSTCLGFIAFICLALGKALFDIFANEYVQGEKYFLVLRTAQHAVNRYLLYWLLVTATLFVLSAISHRLVAGVAHKTRTPSTWWVARSAFLMSSGLALLGFLAVVEFEPIVAQLLRGSEIFLFVRKEILVLIAVLVILSVSFVVAVGGLHRRPANRMRHIAERAPLVLLLVPSFGLIGLLNAAAFLWSSSRDPAQKNVVLITIDTLRADHLATYGHTRVTTPNLDALSSKGILFERAVSQAPWTLPSIATVLTSSYPSDHGADHYSYGLGARTTTLAEQFKNEFYTTIAVVSNTFVNSTYGFSQGFDIFDETAIGDESSISSHVVTDNAIRYVRASHQQPFFLWTHYFDPHYDYLTHADFRYGGKYEGPLPTNLQVQWLMKERDSLSVADINYVLDVYDGEISYTDAHIGRLLGSFAELGISDRTIVVVTADHGEEFLERGRIGHGKNVYDELIRIPLIVYDPTRDDLQGIRVSKAVEIRSVGSTVLEAAGLTSQGFAKPNLLQVAVGHVEPPVCFSEGSYAWGLDQRKLALVRFPWKLISNFDDRSYELYRLDIDPEERHNLVGTEPTVMAELVPLLEERRMSQGKYAGTPTDLSEREYERLKSLGYIQ